MPNEKENRNVIRLRLKDPLRVVMGSIGSDVKYDLETKDISNNGFFLDFEKPGRFPFTPASIMEIWMKLDENETVFFNGKMARVVYPKDVTSEHQSPGIAVRIVQIDTTQEEHLVNFINRKNREQEAPLESA